MCMKLKRLDYDLTVCKVESEKDIDLGRDYVLVKKENFDRALKVQALKGYDII